MVLSLFCSAFFMEVDVCILTSRNLKNRGQCRQKDQSENHPQMTHLLYHCSSVPLVLEINVEAHLFYSRLSLGGSNICSHH
jgi:hypothetical protein